MRESPLSGRRAIVTGGTGYVGGAMVRHRMSRAVHLLPLGG